MSRHIYVDIDDVLSRTVESLIDLLEKLHDRRIDVHECLHFDLGRSFALDTEALEHFMHHAHRDESIESIEPEEGAVPVLETWRSGGDRITLVTGRPPHTRAASLRWLETHGFGHDELHHLDKWGRPSWNAHGLPALRFEEIGELGFEFAVEDSPDTAVRLVEEFEIPVALMDRPWNRDLGAISPATRSRMVRCRSWSEVVQAFGAPDSEPPEADEPDERGASAGRALGGPDQDGEG
jgi:uncharacterized HAD superfamily protein